ncbi:ABC transporter ATP-binding protein [Kutzneria sp. 744]|uniref:ABC transporter ATP-binding protein n=1 Tax=Kutzneria sp. (strain 744) TaxID=345341 RepID=UPI0003EEBCF4|nr:ABC transporter ATP-binding protein [Kutzneria sp. 744]EWM11944.1 ABC transporter ATP-binding protein [Kutzneria sp. 744]
MDSVTPVLSSRAVFRRFWPLTRKDRRWLTVGAVLLIAAAACDSVAVSMFSTIVDGALKAGDLSAFWLPAGIWAGVAVLSGGLVFGGQYLTARSGERFLLRLRTKVFGHLQKLTPDFFQRRRLGDLLARLTDDIDTVERFVSSGLVQIVTALFSVVFFAGYALYLNWELALAAFLVAPVFAVITRRFARRVNDRSREQRAQNGDITAILEENLANVAVVQAYNRQETEEKRLLTAGKRMLDTNLSIARLGAWYAPIVHIAETTCVLGVVALGTWEVAAGRLSIGGVLGFAAILTYLYGPLQQLGQLRVMISAATTGSERIVELLDAEPPLADAPDAVSLGRAKGNLSLRAVSFTYPEAMRPALVQCTVDARPGEIVAITGASGAGKSTIAKLLLRFHDPDAGTIRLDGVDLRGMTLESLRRNVALVQQETLMFTRHDPGQHQTGSATATDRDVRSGDRRRRPRLRHRAAGRYDTVIGQHGHGLSGGQRQRIAIARAMVANAPVLVLDEPTASLDGEAVDRLIGPLCRLTAGRTTVLITHDARLTAIADRVLTVADGRLVEGRSDDTPGGAPVGLTGASGPPWR